VSRAWPDCTV